MDFGIGSVYNFYGNRMTFCRDKEAIYEYDTDRRYTYGDLKERSAHVASYLINKLAVQKGDRIGLCSLNRVEFFDLFFEFL